MTDCAPKSPFLPIAQRPQPSGVWRVSCRGEDSNLCCLFLHKLKWLPNG